MHLFQSAENDKFYICFFSKCICIKMYFEMDLKKNLIVIFSNFEIKLELIYITQVLNM